MSPILIRRTWRLIGTLVLLPAIGACTTTSVFGLRGSGTITTEERSISGVREVVLLGSGNVKIEITGTESLIVEAEDNLMEFLTTEVKGGELELGTSRTISPTEEISYTITLVSLDGVSISGSGDIEVPDVEGEEFTADIAGSGSINAADMNVGAVTAEISGSGSITMTGTTNNLSVDISGSGGFQGSDLVAVDGDITVAGSGDATVHVTGRLSADISGSGDIRYLGDPSVSSSTSGSGNVERA